MFSRSIIHESKRVIDESRSKIDDSRVTLQLVESFTITIYDYHIYIVQATGVPLISLSEQCRQLASLACIGYFCIITT
jgi:hypothetical protein